jgi:hypothetical protein
MGKVRNALHPDPFIVAESGGAVVYGDNEQKDTGGEMEECERINRSDKGIYRELEQRGQSL